MAYATLADLAAYTGFESTAFGDERLLQRASERVDEVLLSSFYTTDSTGAATDPVVVDALKRAVCAQVEWWKATDDELGAGSTNTSPASMIQTARVGGLCEKALGALRVAGIWRRKPLAF